MESLASILTNTSKCLYEPAKLGVCYICHYRRMFQNLQSKLDDLALIRADIEERVKVALENGDLILEQVQRWITDVEEIEANAKKLEDEVKEKKKCFRGWCPDWNSNHLLGKETASKMADVDRLLNEGKIFSAVSIPQQRPPIDLLPTELVEAFASRDSVAKKIIKALKSERTTLVGVYGMGGVGKTTLMAEIVKKLKEQNVYDKVVMVTVSQDPDVKEIQCNIGKQLGQTLEAEQDECRRVELLAARLKQENKILIVLDDVWDWLGLNRIGIPCRDEHEGCKIVLMTRRKDVCNLMGCQKSIEIGLLSKKESWELFEKRAGDAVNSPELNTMAKSVVNKCGGLPLALVTLGRALQSKDEAAWRNTLVQLRKANLEDIEDMDAKVLRSLELSYNFLDNEKIKSLFLLCCLFPEDDNIEVEVLFRLAIGEEILDSEDSLMQVRSRVHDWVNKLKASYLLLDGYKEGFVKMHPVVRYVAMSTASHGHGFLVRAGVGWKEWPGGELVVECMKISLIRNKISALPNQSACPKLKMLLLQDNRFLEEIGENFFEGMMALKVLDLTWLGISSLPHSMQRLINIKILLLDRCRRLNDISLIGGLTKLEILSVKGINIEELPSEIAQLTRLKLLDLTDTGDLVKIPPNVISKLSRLEELYMLGSFSWWEVEEKSSGFNASFWEVASLLKQLTTVYICVKNVECLSQEIIGPWEKLKKFKVIVGDEWDDDSNYKKFMKLKNMPNAFPNWVRVLLKVTKYLHLLSCNNIQSLTVPFNSLKKLQELHIVSCLRLRFVFSSALVQNLQQLEKFHLEDCGELEKIIWEEGEEHEAEVAMVEKQMRNPHTFQNLRVLRIYKCGCLKNVMLLRLVQGLPKLIELGVRDCYEMTDIFVAEEEPYDDGCTIPQLQFIELWRLPNVKYLYKTRDGDDGIFLNWPSLILLQIFSCPGLKRLCIGPESAPNLKMIRGKKEWFEGLEEVKEESSVVSKRLRHLFEESTSSL